MTVRRTARSLLAFAAIAAGFLYCLPNHMLADEYVHWPQAMRFAQGDWQLDPWLSTWPTMNFAVGCVLRLFHSEQLWLGRLTIVAFSLLAFAGFLRLANAVQGPTHAHAGTREIVALQWFASPLMLLVCTVLYTDAPALAALIWGAVGVAERRRAPLLIAGIASIMFRQTHLLWFAALLAWHITLTWRAQSVQAGGSAVAKFVRVLREERWTIVVSAIAVICWLVVVATTGGIAFGVNTQPAHHMGLGGVPNVFFSMAVWVAAFAPLAVGTLLTRNPLRTSRRDVVIAATIVFVIVVTASLFFEATLPGNTHPATLVLIRNQALQALNHTSGRVLMIVLCVVGALAWWRMEFAPSVAPFKWPFFFFSALYLLPFSLIEQRYYLPMFTLLAAFRMPQKIRWEWAQLLWSLALSSVLLYHVAYKGRFL